MKFQQSNFVTSVAQLEELPNFGKLPEIAVVGRSNVGKSSLLNHLFCKKNLVKTSSVPGKTRLINFFNVDDEVIFVDLPGYGYAKEAIDVDLEGFLKDRQQIRLLLLLLDSRHTPSRHDQQMLEWITYFRIPTIVVLTKADKLNQKMRTKQAREITSYIPELPFLFYSTTKNIGRAQLIAKITEALRL